MSLAVNLCKTVWIEINISGLIWIQTISLSGGIPKIFIFSIGNFEEEINSKRQNMQHFPVFTELTVGTQRAYFELKYLKIVKMRDAKYSLKMAAEKWRQKFPFLNALYS